MSTELLESDQQALQSDCNIPLNEVSSTRLMRADQDQSYFQAKYFVDRLVGSVLLIALSPLIGILWLLVKATSPGTGFYSQTRVGLGGRLFKVFKLRSMVCNAEAGVPVWSSKGDKRITPVGRLLRKLHLDELPQLWNVACGDMSLVGPRPERPEITEELVNHIPHYHRRHQVKPGITGLSQVNLEPDTNVNLTRKKQILDIRYINTTNVWLDLRLVLATALRVLGVPGTLAMNLANLKQKIEHHELVQVGYEFDTPEKDLWTPEKGLARKFGESDTAK